MIIMLVATVIVFFVFRAITGTRLALPISFLFLVIWCIINYRAGTKGLIRSNLRAYFRARSQGMGSDVAIGWVLFSRYPKSELDRNAVSLEFLSRHLSEEVEDQEEMNDSEEDKVADLILTIFCYEQKNALKKLSDSQQEEKKLKISDRIRKQYDSMKRKYKV